MPEGRAIAGVRGGAHRQKRRWVVIDGEPWREVSADVIRVVGLRDGEEVDTLALEARIREAEPRLARERALRLLSARERTESDLLRRLHEDGYPEGIARSTVADLARSGLVDDGRFAETMARMLVDVRGFGRGRALRELIRRGVGEEMAQAALDEAAPAGDERRRAVQAAGRLCRGSDTTEKLAARLVRRGFAPADAFSAAREHVCDGNVDGPEPEC